MTGNPNDNGFSYTFRSGEQNEIKMIREKYVNEGKEENTLEKLRRLDRSTTQKSTAFSLVLGVIGTLLLGIGMSLIMTDFGDALGVWQIVIGVFSGVIGIAVAALAYPVYIVITKKERARLAPEIIRLSDELLK